MAELQVPNNGPICISDFGPSADWNEQQALHTCISTSQPPSLPTDALPSNSSVDCTCLHSSLTPISTGDHKSSASSFKSSTASIQYQQQTNPNAFLTISETNGVVIPQVQSNDQPRKMSTSGKSNRKKGGPSSMNEIISQVENDNKPEIPVGTATNSESSTKKTTFGVSLYSSSSTKSSKKGSSSSPRKSTSETSSSSPRKSKTETSSSKKNTNQNPPDTLFTKSEELTESISFSEPQKTTDPSSYSASQTTDFFVSSSKPSNTQVSSKVSYDSPNETNSTQTESPPLIVPQNNTTETSNEPSPLKIPSSTHPAYQSTEEESEENRPSTAKRSVNNQSSLKCNTRSIQKSAISPESHCCLLL